MTSKGIERFYLQEICASPFRRAFQLMTATNQQSILSTIIVGIYRTPSEWLTDILLQLSPIFSSIIFAFKK